MLTVSEVSRLSGVSVRALHHYDSIGLLPPTTVTGAGYRLYDEKALARLQTILLLRELEFPLKEIKLIVENPDFDEKAALKQQIELLSLKRSRLDKLITLAREIYETGVNTMNFEAFDKSKVEAYAKEAKEKWGGTPAYKEYARRAESISEAEQKVYSNELMQIFAKFGEIKSESPEGDKAISLAKELQGFITAHYYNCTPEILSGLGRMYVQDERFRQTIDAAGGEGTANFAAEAIKAYCSNPSEAQI